MIWVILMKNIISTWKDRETITTTTTTTTTHAALFQPVPHHYKA
jgi:hypothetical protein